MILLSCNAQDRSAIVRNDQRSRAIANGYRRKYGAVYRHSDIDIVGLGKGNATHFAAVPDAYLLRFWQRLKRRRAIVI